MSLLRVVTYHRVADPGDPSHLDPRLISATPQDFSRQIAYLSRNFEVIGVADLLDCLQAHRPLPSKALLITFDDGYRDFEEVAWPILKSHSCPAALFVPTAYPDNPKRLFWWDTLHQIIHSGGRKALSTRWGTFALDSPEGRAAAAASLIAAWKDLPPPQLERCLQELVELSECRLVLDNHLLGWDRLRRLQQEGAAIGAHTRNHVILTHLSQADIRREVRDSLADLSRNLGETLPIFCYPSGAHSARVADVLRSEGILLAFTTAHGGNRIPGTSLLSLRRTNITRRTSLPLFRFRLSAVGLRLDAWRHRHNGWAGSAAAEKVQDGPAGSPGKQERGPRIAYLMSRFPKLTETFVLFEILALQEKGVTVDIYPLLRDRQAVVHGEAERLTDQARYHPFLSLPILSANWHYLRRRPFVYLKTLAKALWGTVGSLNFFVGALGIFPKSVRFAYEIEKSRVDHVHAHFANHPALAALVIHRLTGIPYSFTAHGSDLHVDQTMLAEKVRSARLVVTVSNYNREFILAHTDPAAAGKIEVVRCGVDLQTFRPVRREPLLPFRILCVGSLEEVKGHRFLIDACRTLSERGFSFECDLVGSGPLHAQLSRRIRQAGLSSQVRLLGPKCRGDVIDLLKGTDVLVLASVPTRQGKREGIPVALMEGMACGLPVVSSSISGIPELIDHGRNGLLVPPADARALADALEELMTDPARRAALGQAARHKVSRDFDLRANTALLVRLFMRDCSGSGDEPLAGVQPRTVPEVSLSGGRS